MVDYFSLLARAVSALNPNTSEQRRPLLLPQEVKELGRDRELIFYEGLRPILARKNRYYEDRTLRKRILPPPGSPAPTRRRGTPEMVCRPEVEVPNEIIDATEAREPEIPAGASVTESESVGEGGVASGERDGTIADIDRIEELTLDDYAVQFPDLSAPSEGRMSDQQMSLAVNDFLQSLKSG